VRRRARQAGTAAALRLAAAAADAAELRLIPVWPAVVSPEAASSQVWSPEQIKALIRDVPDFPKPGILFRDITPLLGSPRGFDAAVAQMADALTAQRAEGLVAIESRGFLFGAALALRLQLPLQLVRKPGKLPSRTVGITYALEYGSDRLEMHLDAVDKGRRYSIVDDVLASGGTAAAAAALIRELGGAVAGAAFLIELPALQGRQRLPGVDVASLLSY
jgi:adenine phosphoribosyltransferase